jgi:hypothetical protein
LKKKLFVFGSGLAIMILTSCSSAFVQKSYFPSSPNVNCFDKKGEFNAKAAISLSHLDLQANYAINKNFGVSSTGFIGTMGQMGFESCGIYYKNFGFNDNKYFEIQTGYGYTNINCTKEMSLDLNSIFSSHGIKYYQKTDAKYHKIIAQPFLCIYPDSRDRDFNLGIAIKLSGIYYSNYYFNTIKTDTKNYPKEARLCTETNFNFKWGLVCEPVLVIKYNYIFIQIGAVFSNNIQSSPIMLNQYTNSYGKKILESSEEVGQSRNPQHVRFVISGGFQIKIDTRKKGKKNSI